MLKNQDAENIYMNLMVIESGPSYIHVRDHIIHMVSESE